MKTVTVKVEKYGTFYDPAFTTLCYHLSSFVYVQALSLVLSKILASYV